MKGYSATLATALEAGAEVEVVGQIAWSSNATFLVELSGPDAPLRGIYKPSAGERPLQDFPPGIWKREIAAYELSVALGWNCIPETIALNGPYGQGSLQRFVEVDYDRHYFTMIDENDPVIDDQLRQLCCFDLVANNTDRKAGHCLVDANDHVWGIDNALCFHAQFKLRTVIWDFAGEPIAPPLQHDLTRFVEDGPGDPLVALLDPFELDALVTRATAVSRSETFPVDPTGRRYPWPLI